MKRTYLTYIILCMAMLLLLFHSTEVQAQENNAEVITSGDFQYMKIGMTDVIKIVNYTGTDEKVVIPEYIDGKKVIELTFMDELRLFNTTTKEIEISYGIQRIGGFSGCRNLEKITIPDSVTEINEYTFKMCGKLKEVYVPDSVELIGDEAFYGCERLKKVRLPDGLLQISDGTFAWCEKLTKIEIPDGVTDIGESAFHGCSSLKRIDIPDSVNWIGEYAFGSCSKLTKVKLSKNIKTIREGTFFGCGLKTIEIPKKVIRIEDEAFLCADLTKVVIPSKVKYIGKKAFQTNKKLKSITFKGKTPPKIKEKAFYYLPSKVVFNVPNTSINKYKKILQNKKVYNGKKLNIK